jgi:hypothetical protein
VTDVVGIVTVFAIVTVTRSVVGTVLFVTGPVTATATATVATAATGFVIETADALPIADPEFVESAIVTAILNVAAKAGPVSAC